MLHNEGETAMLDVFLRGATAPTNFYVGLCAGTPAEGTTLATLTGEPVGNGYARQVVARAPDATGWPTLALDGSSDAKATAKEVTFTCSTAAWSQVTHAFVCTNAASGTTGALIASQPLATARTLQVGDSLKVTFALTQQ